MDMHYIAEDLENHDWYVDLVTDVIVVLERYLAAWAAFEDAIENA